MDRPIRLDLFWHILFILDIA